MASITAGELIQASLETIGIYGPGETMTDADAARGLAELNEMLDQWAAEYLYVYQLTTQTATLTTAQASYTIGNTGTPDVSGVRPLRVQYGQGAAAVTISTTTTPVAVVSAVEWNSIYNVSPGVGTPNALYYDPQYPLGVLNVAPTPNAGASLSFSSLVILSSFAGLTTSANLSQGVLDAVQASLAVRLKPFYSEGQLDPAVGMRAAEAKDLLRYQTLNSRALLKRTMVSTGRQPVPGANSR